jgi:hypothetical protein
LAAGGRGLNSWFAYVFFTVKQRWVEPALLGHTRPPKLNRRIFPSELQDYFSNRDTTVGPFQQS